MFQLQNIKQNPEFMSKEQTPITAKEFLEQNYCLNMGIRIDKYHRPDMYTSDAMEQYAQAKVLEFAEWEQSNTAHLNYPPKELVDMFTKQK